MTPAELKAKSTKSITAPISGQEFAIRKLTFLEMNKVKFNVIIGSGNGDVKPRPDLKEGEPKPELTFTELALENDLTDNAFHFCLENGVVTPRIVFAEEKGEEVPEGAIDARWVAEDLGFIFSEILAFSGFNKENEKKVEDLKANPSSPASLTA